MNLHTPQRLQGESQEDYRARRKASAKAVQVMTCSTTWKQHSLPSSREKLRDEQRNNGKGPRAYYGAGLLQPQRKRNQRRMEKIHTLRDDSGAYTLVGSGLKNGPGAAPLMGVSLGNMLHNGRRMWLAGISAQRGY